MSWTPLQGLSLLLHHPISQGGDKLTLNVSGLGESGPAMGGPALDDSVTVTHFSLDSWGKIEQTTTPLIPKVANQPQNPFNPFTSGVEADAEVQEVVEEKGEVEETDEVRVNTNPFIESNPFLGLLNPFNDVAFTEKKSAPEKRKEDKPLEGSSAKVVKTEEIQTTTTTLTHRVRKSWCLALC